MLLIGQYDSPFVRRVGIALRLYGMPFRHEPWSVFGDTEKIRRYSPLGRVPTLVLEDGAVLVDSPSILDHLDDLAGPERALVPATGTPRRQAMFLTALAMGVAEKAVSLFYEQRLHSTASPVWVERCRTQIAETLARLEQERAASAGPFLLGARMLHADIALAVALRFVAEAHPGLVPMGGLPALAAHATALEALPVFQEISQPFIPPT